MDNGGTDAIRGPRGKKQGLGVENQVTLEELKYGGVSKWSWGHRRG